MRFPGLRVRGGTPLHEDPTTPAPSAVPAPSAPAARRSRPNSWRSPRLLVGVLLLTGAVLIGAKVLAAADDTVGVWVAARDLPSGVTPAEADLTRRQIRFTDETNAARYLPAGRAVPGRPLTRAVRAGELLPRSALEADAQRRLVEVPLSVHGDDLPVTVRQGSVVDVWVTPETPPAGQEQVTAVRVLEEVLVIEVPAASRGLAPQSTRQVIVGVPVGADGGSASAASLAGALGAMVDGRVVLTRRG